MTTQHKTDYGSGDHTRLWEHLNAIGGIANDNQAAGTDVLNAFTASTGWSISSQRLRKFLGGQITAYNINLVRTGSAIAVTAATGNIVDTDVCYWSPAAYPLRWATPPITRGGSRVGNWGAGSDGVITLYTVAGTGEIGTGDTFAIGGFWL